MGAVRIGVLIAVVGISAIACGGVTVSNADGTSGVTGTGGATGTGGTGSNAGGGGSAGVTGGAGQGADGATTGGQGGQVIDDCQHSCPIDGFDVITPKDRSQGVEVSVTGPCGSETVTGADPSDHYFQALGVGTCRVTVTFNGARTFQTDVPILPNPGPCCVSQPRAQLPQGVVYVPDSVPIDASILDASSTD